MNDGRFITPQEAETIQEGFSDAGYLAQLISSKHGFWENGDTRNKPEMIALMHSELSEALEVLRKDPEARSAKCPEHSALAEELADCVIRILDFAHGFDLDLPAALIAKMEYNASRPYKHGKKF